MQLKDIGEDLRPDRREGAASIELDPRDVSLGEARDATLHPAEIERHAFVLVIADPGVSDTSAHLGFDHLSR